MRIDFPFSFWGIQLEKLQALEVVCERIENYFELAPEFCNDLEFDSRELAERNIRMADYPFSDLTTIICSAKLETLVNEVCMAKKLNPEDFEIDASVDKPSVIYKGDQL